MLFESLIPKDKENLCLKLLFIIIFLPIPILPWIFVWCFAMPLKSLMQKKIKKIDSYNSDLCRFFFYICAPKPVRRMIPAGIKWLKACPRQASNYIRVISSFGWAYNKTNKKMLYVFKYEDKFGKKIEYDQQNMPSQIENSQFY